MNLIASRHIPVGYELPSLVWTAKFRRTWEKERWTDNVHRDDGVQRHGFAGGLAEGDFVVAKLVEPLVMFFGEQWYRSGKIKVKVLPVYGGDLLRTRCVVTNKVEEKGGVRFELDVRLQKENGEPGVVGTASCLVP